MGEKRLVILLLSEDVKGASVLQSVLTRTFHSMVPGFDQSRVEFQDIHRFIEEGDERARIREVCMPTRWDSRNPEHQAQLARLLDRIVTGLRKHPLGFVFVHADGDKPWSLREHSANRKSFDALRLKLQQKLAPPNEPTRAQRRARPNTVNRHPGTEGAEMTLERFVCVMPFYSMEAWLYQNTDFACELCQTRDQGRCVPLINEWASNRGELDEIEKVKEHLCFQDSHNTSLAERFTVTNARNAEKSFEEFYKALQANSQLLNTLAKATFESP